MFLHLPVTFFSHPFKYYATHLDTVQLTATRSMTGWNYSTITHVLPMNHAMLSKQRAASGHAWKIIAACHNPWQSHHYTDVLCVSCPLEADSCTSRYIRRLM